MSRKLITCLNEVLTKFEDAITTAILKKLQPGLCIASLQEAQKQPSKFSIKDILKDGFLWGVPKHRRSVEKRLCRKFGVPKYVWKPFVLKTNLVMCRACGHHHEAYTICGHCYEKVSKETKEIQQVMDKELKLNPITDEIVISYQEEPKPEDFWKNQRVIEMPKKRPSWFQNNLLEPTTQKLSDDKEVKPDGLA